jgi:hypothetical protein
MSNEFFTKSGVPATRGAGSSAAVRSEFALVEAAFDKLPALTGNRGKAVVVNSAETGLEAVNTIDTDAPVAGIDWVVRASAENNSWYGVAYGNGIFVAVAESGTNRIMTSPDGINWTARAAPSALPWRSITFGNGLFVAAAAQLSANNIMTSPDGINWTARTPPVGRSWNSIAYGNGRFVVVSHAGVSDNFAYSLDGVTWVNVAPPDTQFYYSVTFGAGLFVAMAIGSSTQGIVTSPDGITWTQRVWPYVATIGNFWCVAYGNGIFVAVGSTGTGNRVMTSGRAIKNEVPDAGVIQGEKTFREPIAIGNTVNSVSPTSPNRTVTIVVDGVTLYLHAKTTND